MPGWSGVWTSWRREHDASWLECEDRGFGAPPIGCRLCRRGRGVDRAGGVDRTGPQGPVMKKSIVIAALAGALVVPAMARAHGGHVHKVIGTVSAVTPTQIEVKTTDGKTAAVSVTPKTVYQHDKAKVEFSALKVGNRVVIEGTQADGAKTVTAQTVRIGTVSAAAKK